MLDKLRADALALIAATPHCTLSTAGPAGLQASIVTCVVHDACLYVQVPSTADHLFNLEYSSEVLLTSTLWQLRGAALALEDTVGRRGTAPRTISDRAHANGHLLIEVFPLQMHTEAIGEERYRATIDFSAPASHTWPTTTVSAS